MNQEEKAQYKILILEDEKTIAQNTKEMLEELGYQISGVTDSYDTAIKSAKANFPDVALCDIVIKGYKDGIEVANKLQEMGDLAVVFLTAHFENEIKSRAFATEPQGYLLKPSLNQVSLDIHIQLAIQNLNNKKQEQDQTKIADGKYYAWDRGIYHVIKLKDILYVKADNNNALIYTTQRIIDVNKTFGKVMKDLAEQDITQINRSYAVNLEKVISFDNRTTFVELDEEEISSRVKKDEGWSRSIDISATHRDKIRAYFNLS